MKQRLALGHQEFSKVIENKCIYVDKTQQIYELVSKGEYFFFSRPRRFGKSLLCNTIKEVFLGNKELFKGLWIYDKWDWETKIPVLKISFASVFHNTLGLEPAINQQLRIISEELNIELTEDSYTAKFVELIKKMATKNKVAIIIDEYDKPIIDHIDNLEMAEKNREILQNFYSGIKDADSYIRFFFVTGVSKFSKVSIFSKLNNLIDISMDNRYSNIVGWTEKEVTDYFPDYISDIGERFKDYFPDIMKHIRGWYNGYSWDGVTSVYNPVSLMNLFQKQDFRNYWFETGTPTFLMKLIKQNKYTAFDIENTTVSSKFLDKYEINEITLIALLFQTGYLTIKKYDIISGDITLDYPNREVADAFSTHILAKLSDTPVDKTDNLLYRIRRSFLENEIEDFIEYINTLFANIPYNLIENKEKYFHSQFYLIMKIIGYIIDVEVLTIKGRIDAVIRTDDNIFILEFKINQSARKAIEQINEKQYAQKYKDDNRKINILGINYDTEKKLIDDYILEILP